MIGRNKPFNPAELASQTFRRIGLLILFFFLPLLSLEMRRAGVLLFPTGVAFFFLSYVFSPHSPPIAWAHFIKTYRNIILALALCIVWIAITLIWSVEGDTGLGRLIRLVSAFAMIAGAALVLPNRIRVADLYLVMCCSVFYLLLLSSIVLFDLQFFSENTVLFSRAQFISLLLFWPVASWISYRSKIGFAALFVTANFALLFLLFNPLLFFVLTLSASIYMLSRALPKSFAPFLMYGFIGIFAFWPLLLFVLKSFGFDEEWNALMLPLSFIKLLFGSGFDASRALPQETSFLTFYSRLWYELGLIGVILISGFFILIIQRIGQMNTHFRAALLANIFLIMGIWNLTDVGLQGWWVVQLSLVFLTHLMFGRAIESAEMSESEALSRQLL